MFNSHSGLKKIAIPAVGRQSNGPLFILRNVFGLIALVSITYVLTGCGAQVVAGKGLDASQGVFTASPNSVNFGTVNVGTSANNTVSLVNSSSDAVIVSNLSVSGASSFSLASEVQLPFTLAPGSTTPIKLSYLPTGASTDSGSLVISSNSMIVPTATVSLKGQGNKPVSSNPQPVLTAFVCTNGSLTGAGTDACSVTLNSAAPDGGFSVGLASSSAAVSVPQTVTVPASATSVGFTATASAVSSVQFATLTASAGGTTKNFAVQLQPLSSPTAPNLTLSAATLAFGNVVLNTPAKQTLTLTSSGTAPLTISAAKLSGTGFAMSGATFPVTLNPGQAASLTVQFDPTSAGAASGQIAITSNAANGATADVALSGTGNASPPTAPSLSALSCNSGSMTGSGSDSCTVTLNSAAPSGGLSVTLASNNKAVTLPASVTVPANASSAGFSAAVSAVSAAQAATLTATANGVTKSFALNLSAAGGTTLSINATSISFGNVPLNTPSTQSVTLTASGTSAVTVSSASVSGTGFSLSGAKFPMTVLPGTPATLSVQFDPTSSGAATGQLSIADNSTNNANPKIGLSGTGASLQIALNWDAPSSTSDAVTAYNVYRAVSGSSSYAIVKSGNAQTSFTDSSIKSGTTYEYYVTSLDSTGAESTPSNTATVAVP